MANDADIIDFAQCATRWRRRPPEAQKDDDELHQRAAEKIADWRASADLPKMIQVQSLFHELICAGASNMLRDKVVDAVVAAFGKQFGGKRALTSTWNAIAK